MKKRGMKYCCSEVNIHPAYKRQQAAIKDVCQELGLVAFYPDYHGADRDKNTVLVYLPEDDKYNKELEKNGVPMGGYCLEEPYRKPLWTFENTDVNGLGNYDFANRGTLDLRGLDECDVIKGAIEFSYYRHKQYEYTCCCGGVLGVREADDTYNDLNRKILESFSKMNNGKIFIAKAERKKETTGLIKYDGYVSNFGCDLAVPRYDKELDDMIKQYSNSDSSIAFDDILKRVSALNGLGFVWY